jgi:hypothetical protein
MGGPAWREARWEGLQESMSIIDPVILPFHVFMKIRMNWLLPIRFD